MTNVKSFTFKAVLLEQQEKEASNTSSRSSDALVPDLVIGGEVYQRSACLHSPEIITLGDPFMIFSHLWWARMKILTNVEKMHYLKTCIAGDAAWFVINLKVTDKIINIAWKILVSQYENERVLISMQLDRLFSLKLIKSKST